MYFIIGVLNISCKKGLTLYEGPLYTIDVKGGITIASAVWNTDTIKGRGNKHLQLWLRKGAKDHLFAILDKDYPYVSIGLKFDDGESVGFYMVGRGQANLSGFAEEENQVEIIDLLNVKPETENSNSQSKKRKTNSMKSESDEKIANGSSIENGNGENGTDAQIGDEVSVYYECCAHPSNDTFISHLAGKPYKFTLGDSTVCVGMTNAIIGMTKGQKKSITCPPQEAFGDFGIPSIIPPKATVTFHIEVIDIKKSN